MKTVPTEHELLALHIAIIRAKLRLNEAQLDHARRKALLPGNVLLSAANRGRNAWQWLSFLPVGKTLRRTLTAAWLLNILKRGKK